MSLSKSDAVEAAMKIATDVTEGKMQVSELEAAAIEQCRELFATVYGPEDALWELHIDVARQVFHMGGFTAAELSEWVAVMRSREGEKPEQSWIERALADGADEDEPAADIAPLT